MSLVPPTPPTPTPAAPALPGPLPAALLPPGVRSRFVPGINGLRMHLLEAGFDSPGRPVVLLLHGFPELAYSWRHVLPALAAAGYHAIAPDLRGYGRTTGWADGARCAHRPLPLVQPGARRAGPGAGPGPPPGACGGGP